MYFTDRGIDELIERRGDEFVTLACLAGRLRAFVQFYPNFNIPTEQFAAWLAESEDDDPDAVENAHC